MHCKRLFGKIFITFSKFLIGGKLYPDPESHYTHNVWIIFRVQPCGIFCSHLTFLPCYQEASIPFSTVWFLFLLIDKWEYPSSTKKWHNSLKLVKAWQNSFGTLAQSTQLSGRPKRKNFCTGIRSSWYCVEAYIVLSCRTFPYKSMCLRPQIREREIQWQGRLSYFFSIHRNARQFP